MVVTLNDSKRAAIADKLAEMSAIQDLLISNGEKLLQACADEDIRKRMRDMVEDDRKNKGIIETTIVQYGVKGQPRQVALSMIERANQMINSADLNLFEKFAQHELLKHTQAMTGLLLHKAAQVIGADVDAAIGPLNTVNFESRAHQEQLKGILEVLGTRELTGQNPDQGLWARVQDAIAAMTGVAGSVVTQSSNKSDMDIRDILRMDHTKANTLFMEIEGTDNPQKIQEYFGQLYKDLTAHAEAEEEAVYPQLRSYYGDMQELYDEQSEMKQKLEQLKAMSPSSPEFKQQARQLRDMVQEHIRQEENELFPQIRNNLSESQREKMATQFKASKSKIQDRLAGLAK